MFERFSTALFFGRTESILYPPPDICGEIFRFQDKLVGIDIVNRLPSVYLRLQLQLRYLERMSLRCQSKSTAYITDGEEST